MLGWPLTAAAGSSRIKHWLRLLADMGLPHREEPCELYDAHARPAPFANYQVAARVPPGPTDREALGGPPRLAEQAGPCDHDARDECEHAGEQQYLMEKSGRPSPSLRLMVFRSGKFQ